MQLKSILAAVVGSIVAIVAGQSASLAQEFPNRPIRIIVPFSPGASTDTMARLTAVGMAKELNSSVVVENKVGAGSLIGTDFVAHASADGYTLLWASLAQPLFRAFVKDVKFDPVTAFTPILMIAEGRLYLTSSSTVPAHTLNEFIAYARANPGKLNVGSTGPGKNLILLEYINHFFNLGLVQVTYGGTADVNVAMLGGQVHLTLQSALGLDDFIKNDKMRMIAVTGVDRSKDYPNVPTIAESGVTLDLDRYAWHGIVAPKGTPTAIVSKLAAAIETIRHDPEFKQKLITFGYEASTATGEQFAQKYKDEAVTWTKIAQDIGIKPE